MERWRGILASRKGMALVLTLMALSIITALVVEFAYEVYVNTSLLYNWQAGQRLSLLTSSGASLAAQFVAANVLGRSYNYPGSVTLPPQEPFKDGISISLRLEDENSRFNLKTLVLMPNGTANEKAISAFRRLLKALSLKEEIADLLVDWMDRDELPRQGGSEKGMKNAPLESVEEILQIPGVKREVYDKLLPYVTTYSAVSINSKAPVNINSASVPVLMSLFDEDIPDGTARELARRVVDYREITPFQEKGNLQKVAGFESLYVKISDNITVKGTAFGIKVTASLADGLKRSVHCVIDTGGVVRYWREA